MEQNNKTQTKIIETYAEDMAKVLESDKGGMIKKIIHEEEEHEMVKKNFSPESKKNKIFMLIGLVFIVLGAVILSAFVFNREVPTVSVEKQFTPIIFTDKSVFLEVKDLKPEEISQTIANEVAGTQVKNGGVEGIYLTLDKKIVGLRQLISLIKGNFVPPENVFLSDNFLMGVVNDETKDPFILIKVRSLADVFDSFRAWENKMFTDLRGLFDVAISPETKYLLTANFDDGIVENKNARILHDKNGGIVMMYIMADDNSVVITNTVNAAREIMLRLASSQVKK